MQKRGQKILHPFGSDMFLLLLTAYVTPKLLQPFGEERRSRSVWGWCSERHYIYYKETQFLVRVVWFEGGKAIT
jgi:hypothetical protein